MSNHDAPTLLLVEDEVNLRERLARALKNRGYEVRAADSLAAARQASEEDSPELAILDLRLPDGNGLSLVSALREIDPSTRIVVLTGYGSIATAVEAIRLGAVNYVTKPATTDQILAAFQPDDAGAHAELSTPSLARVEWEHIQRVLADCEGNVSEAARRLGVHRRSLQRKLSKKPVIR